MFDSIYIDRTGTVHQVPHFLQAYYRELRDVTAYLHDFYVAFMRTVKKNGHMARFFYEKINNLQNHWNWFNTHFTTEVKDHYPKAHIQRYDGGVSDFKVCVRECTPWVDYVPILDSQHTLPMTPHGRWMMDRGVSPYVPFSGEDYPQFENIYHFKYQLLIDQLNRGDVTDRVVDLIYYQRFFESYCKKLFHDPNDLPFYIRITSRSDFCHHITTLDPSEFSYRIFPL